MQEFWRRFVIWDGQGRGEMESVLGRDLERKIVWDEDELKWKGSTMGSLGEERKRLLKGRLEETWRVKLMKTGTWNFLSQPKSIFCQMSRRVKCKQTIPVTSHPVRGIEPRINGL